MENLIDYSVAAQTGSILEQVIYICLSLGGAFLPIGENH